MPDDEGLPLEGADDSLPYEQPPPYLMRQCEHKPNPYTFIDGATIWWLCWDCHVERTLAWKAAMDRHVAEASLERDWQ